MWKSRRAKVAPIFWFSRSPANTQSTSSAVSPPFCSASRRASACICASPCSHVFRPQKESSATASKQLPSGPAPSSRPATAAQLMTPGGCKNRQVWRLKRFMFIYHAPRIQRLPRSMRVLRENIKEPSERLFHDIQNTSCTSAM